MKPELLVTMITDEIATLNEHSLDTYSGDTLSRLAVRLAALKAGLGSYLVDAKKATWQAEKAYKEAKAQGFIELKAEGQNSTDAKELTVLKANAKYEAFIEAQVLENKVATLSYNVHDLIDAIKSRVINLQMEARDDRG